MTKFQKTGKKKLEKTRRKRHRILSNDRNYVQQDIVMKKTDCLRLMDYVIQSLHDVFKVGVRKSIFSVELCCQPKERNPEVRSC